MNGNTTVFIEPLDVWFFRGNKLFGDPGSYGESLIPPWPSVVAGALRSRILADDGVDLAAFAKGAVPHPTLGTPERPGSFVLAGFSLARRFADGRTEPLVSLPADLVVFAEASGASAVHRLVPQKPHSALRSNYPLTKIPVLPVSSRGKPVGGYWLGQAGWSAYLSGQTPEPDHLVRGDQLWKLDERVGVGLDPKMRAAAEGQLFTVQAVSPARLDQGAQFSVGFLATVRGAAVPTSGLLRLGGDGRAAALSPADPLFADPDFEQIAADRRCRILLTTPGLFPDGWLPPGAGTDGSFRLKGVTARITCAVVPRSETVSGWDLARQRPKASRRAVPPGAVYWLEDLEAEDPARALGELMTWGLWPEDLSSDDALRRAEGFNRFTFAHF